MNIIEHAKMAKETIEILQMWGLNKADTLAVAQSMVRQIEGTPDNEWKDPLKGTGLKLDLSKGGETSGGVQ